jgi:hypothetical protein
MPRSGEKCGLGISLTAVAAAIAAEPVMRLMRRGFQQTDSPQSALASQPQIVADANGDDEPHEQMQATGVGCSELGGDGSR